MASDDGSDRERGILTPTDREFLTGDQSEYTDASIRQKRYRINRRIRESIKDFSLLLEHLSQDRLGKIFHPEDQETRNELWEGVRAGLALFFLQQYEESRHMNLPNDWDVSPDRFFIPPHEQNLLVEAGLRRALKAREESLHDYQEFEYRTAPLDHRDLMRRFNSGEPLTLEEFETLQREATTDDMRWQTRVVHEFAFMDNAQVTEEDEVLLPSDRRLVWNRPLKENEDTTPSWVDEDDYESDEDA